MLTSFCADKVTDFLRIAIFCKNAIDNFNLSTAIGFQVVEVVSLEIPLKKSDLLNLVGRFDDLATLSYICTPSTRDISHLRIETSQYSYVCDGLDQSKTKKHFRSPSRKLRLMVAATLKC
ncbi:uncharacterized protein BX664DRAFT_385624 [Halteromyces radiatus]|uniref:uncharacterized protein n=1 Tax=Halteromyces radiatus TaxID=101107 RepID=UPI0022203902|nr:uncharacterized protein BX664DRAFT_385624 [Halteromyces radiatus]KAI8089066.1 hypothetical protein BX664DRAFT_385624 [Halteromyces radiatus]